MQYKKLSELPLASDLANDDLLEVTQGGVSKKITGAHLKQFIDAAEAEAAADAQAAAASATTAATKAAEALAAAAAASAIALGVATGMPNIRPSLLLDFANSKVVDPRITFTRASTATYYDANGVMQTASANVPRINHDPATGKCLGLLTEESRTNLLLWSSEFDNASWAKTFATVTANAATAPDGNLTADKLIPTSAANQHSVAAAAVAAGTYTFSCYMKAGELSYGALTAYDGTSYKVGTLVDLVAGTIMSTVAGSTATISPVGNGWFRVTTTATTVGNAPFAVRPVIAGASAFDITAGDGTSGIYIWGAQLEAGAFPTSYIPTTSAAVTRSADVAAMTGTNFSSWYRRDEGTLAVDCSVLNNGTPSAIQNALLIADASYNNRVSLRFGATATERGGSWFIYSGASTQAFINESSSLVANAKMRFSGSYKANAFVFCKDGVVVGSDLSGTVPVSPTTMEIGSALNGHISRIAYYPKALTNSELQALTA